MKGMRDCLAVEGVVMDPRTDTEEEMRRRVNAERKLLKSVQILNF
jgi:hypothetical protein